LISAKRDTNKLATIVVLAAMAIVASIFVLQHWRPGSKPAPDAGLGKIAVDAAQRPSVPSPNPAIKLPDRGRDRSDSTELRVRGQVAEPLRAPPLSGTDDSVIGVPFPVPASAEGVCTISKRLHGPDLCERQHKLLAKMAKEPRDLAWAAKTETLIQDEVTSLSPGNYSIRNIECRSSICAVEMESLSDWYSGATIEFDNANNLVDGFRLHAVETDSVGREIKVSLVLFNKFDSKGSHSIH
jgi:hypothetical protein